MLAAFQDRAGDDLGTRLIAALQAGLAAGGEVTSVRSAGLVIAESQPWPVTDLRVDWHDDPVGQLARLWPIWQPQVASYISRALRPSEMAQLCGGLAAYVDVQNPPEAGVLDVGRGQSLAVDPGMALASLAGTTMLISSSAPPSA
jgi:uncharacterized Ntn-hydrolase superfamily protein